ncbi:hypothetical protein EJB05_01256, partial [Eragrostis curvula]
MAVLCPREPEQITPPVQLREVSEKELKQLHGPDECSCANPIGTYLVPSLDNNDEMLLVFCYGFAEETYVFGVQVGSRTFTPLGVIGNRAIFLPSVTVRADKFRLLIPGAVCQRGNEEPANLDWMGNGTVAALLRRMVPPTSFDGRPSLLDFSDAVQVDDNEESDALNTGYYIDLLVNDVEESHAQSPPSDPTIHHVPVPANSSQGRDQNLKEKEDILLVIEGRNRSGVSSDYKLASACSLFKAEDKKHRKFAFMHCWKILKDKQ